MVFSSASFLFVFFPVVFCLYRIMPGIRTKNYLLMVSSVLFYAFGEPIYVLILLASVLVNYIAGRMLSSFSRGRKAVVAVTVTANLGMLAVFKYTDFIIDTVNRLFSMSIEPIGIALPIGISFFTFQGLSYVIDVYRDKSLVSRNFAKLVLYISFFPQLIAGPIVKYHDVSAQIDSRETTPELTADGIRRFIIGLSKKLLLANTMGYMADAVFGAAELDARAAWLGALCYMLQIYFDFSGYSDMAIGLGRMFGFRFLENFEHPYASASIKEFWRRWHISLSTWFRDYLYIPLGGNRKGKLRSEINKCVVFFCTGLWHGASWNFVLWGLWHGAFIIVEDFLPRRSKVVKAAWRALTLLTVLLSFVLFRAETISEAGEMFSAMFTGFSFSPQSTALLNSLLTPLNIFSLLAGVLCAFPLLPRIKELIGESTRAASVFEFVSYAAVGLLFLLCVLNLAGSDFNPFIYFRF